MRRFRWVAVILFGASLLYDRGFIRRGDRAGWLEPYTALTVVTGVLYTLAGVWAVDRKAAVLAFWMFVASGTALRNLAQAIQVARDALQPLADNRPVSGPAQRALVTVALMSLGQASGAIDELEDVARETRQFTTQEPRR